MPATGSPSQPSDLDKSCFRKAAALILGMGLMVSMVSAGVCSGIDVGRENSIKTAMRTEPDSTRTELQCAPPSAGSIVPTVVGAASMYNPYRAGYRSGGKETASGEPYDPAAWTAAIQLDLRDQFGGVRYGKNYRPTYVLVECAGKHAIIKINDVGPLKPGRVIDLNEQSMRYCDPSLEVGVIPDVKITLLQGEDWTPGPVGSEQLVELAVAQSSALDAAPRPTDDQQPVSIAPEQLLARDPTPEPVGRERRMNVAAAQPPVEDPMPGPTGDEQSIDVAAVQSPVEDQTPEPTGGEQPIGVALQSYAEEPTPAPIDNEQPAKIDVAQSSFEEQAPESTDGEQPISVAALQSYAEEPMRALIDNEQPARIDMVQSSVEEQASEPTGGEQPTNVAAAQSSAEEPTPAPIGSRQFTHVTAAPYLPSHKIAVIVIPSILITAIAMLLKLPSAAPVEARGTEDRSVKPRARGRRKSGRKVARKSQRKNSQKSKRKDSRKRQRRTRRKTSRQR